MGGYSPIVAQTSLQQMPPMQQPASMAPAPVPSVNAWNKPISFAAVTGTIQVCISLDY